MKYIDVTEKEIVRHRYQKIPVIEIESFEQLSKLPEGTEVAIMNNCEMVIGKVQSKHSDFILIWDNQGIVTVKPNNFEYNNFLYQIA